jgi:hypothetical protein
MRHQGAQLAEGTDPPAAPFEDEVRGILRQTTPAAAAASLMEICAVSRQALIRLIRQSGFMPGT